MTGAKVCFLPQSLLCLFFFNRCTDDDDEDDDGDDDDEGVEMSMGTLRMTIV